MLKYAPKLPLGPSEDDSHEMLKTIKDVVKQNLKMVILTNPGERIMMPNFGVGIHQYFFENVNPVIIEAAKQRIESQVERFLPYVNIQSVIISSDSDEILIPSNTLFVKIVYSIPSLNAGDQLTVGLNSTSF
jgi:phage baseplate assembly protein W